MKESSRFQSHYAEDFAMAQGDMFLELDGIKGESLDDKHQDHIDILSTSLGVSNSSSAFTGAGSGTGKADFHDASFIKYTDSSSCDLFLACINGDHIDKATVYVRRAGGEEALEFLKITMEEVYVTSFQTSASGGTELPTESFSLSFGKIKMEYQKQKEDGSGEPAGEVAWNVKKNKKE